ncbi:hypothetical protein [Lacticaseibacillus jixiensis]|uniref:hypothetical protein n=1 Tax=Lacticaseibacillus jixiensis TaxID=3231926 RepID=UPI0036F25F2B
MTDQPQSNLAQRFAGFDLEAYYANNGYPTEIDCGQPVGEEVITDKRVSPSWWDPYLLRL